MTRSSTSPSSRVRVQSRYSWMVAARVSSAFFVPGRGGGACPVSKALNKNGTSPRAAATPSFLLTLPCDSRPNQNLVSHSKRRYMINDHYADQSVSALSEKFWGRPLKTFFSQKLIKACVLDELTSSVRLNLSTFTQWT